MRNSEFGMRNKDDGMRNIDDGMRNMDETGKASVIPHSEFHIPNSDGWSKPQPEHLSEPTYWPAVMALGITMLLWGIVTSFIISIVGLAVFALALTGWIGELLHENAEQ